MNRVSELEKRNIVGGATKYVTKTCKYCGATFSDWYEEISIFGITITLFYDSACVNASKWLTTHIESYHKGCDRWG